MGEHKHKVEANETKAIKPENEVEQLSGYHPAEVLRQVKDGPPSTLKPAQILALQRTVGNKVVQRMLGERKQQSGPDTQANLSPTGDLIQRHPEDTAKINNLIASINDNSTTFGNALIRHKDLIESHRESANINTRAFGDKIMEHSDLLAQVSARLSNLESSSGGGEEIVVPAAGGI
ncbi:MAG: hypothetical protein WA996_00700 [Candidatus Promineifilaceae bacterium]